MRIFFFFCRTIDFELVNWTQFTDDTLCGGVRSMSSVCVYEYVNVSIVHFAFTIFYNFKPFLSFVSIVQVNK